VELGANMVKSRAPEATRDACIITLPREILANILSYASAYKDTIMPKQLAPGSTKFSIQTDLAVQLGTCYSTALTKRRDALPAELSAFEIARTCYTFHKIIDGDNMFHANNTFEFMNTHSLLNYLAALPSERRNAIRCIKVNYDYHGDPVAAFIMLAVCYRLEYLTLDIGGMTNFFNPGLMEFSQAPGYRQLTALRGLKSVKLVYGNKVWTLIDDILARIPRAWVSPEKSESEKGVLRVLKQLESHINGSTTELRAQCAVARGELRYALNQAGINAWSCTIDSMLTQPGQPPTGISNNYSYIMNQRTIFAVVPAGVPSKLSETEQ
jgi:hypothetical protein